VRDTEGVPAEMAGAVAVVAGVAAMGALGVEAAGHRCEDGGPECTSWDGNCSWSADTSGLEQLPFL
jgi:hypothetical protein